MTRASRPSRVFLAALLCVVLWCVCAPTVVWSATAIDTVADVSIDGAQDSADMGYQTTNAGDVNGDGRDDLMVYSRMEDSNGRPDNGTIYVFFGRATGFHVSVDTWNASMGVRIFGSQNFNPPSYSGMSITPGDLNDDGYDDIVIPTPMYTDEGGAFVIWGSSTVGGDIDLASVGASGIELHGDTMDVGLGYSSAMGDVNCDGVDDLYMGGQDGNGYVLYGGPSFASLGEMSNLVSPTQGVVVAGIGHFASVGDVNADGCADLLVGEMANGGIHNGLQHVVYGSAALANMNLASLGAAGMKVSGSPSDPIGFGSAAGDFNRDGVMDLVVGSPGADFNGVSNAGEVVLLWGPFTGDIDLSVPGYAADIVGGNGFSGNFGLFVMAADYDGDGFEDLLTTAPMESADGHTNNGAVYVFRSRTTWAGVGSASFTEPGDGVAFAGADDWHGFSQFVSYADFNGDGLLDIAAGANAASTGPYNQNGQAYIVYAALPPVAPSNTSPPVITGSMLAGNVLTCQDGIWNDAISYTYEWLNDGVAIAGETASAYTSRSSDGDVSCRVIAHGNGGLQASASSALVSILHPPANITPPTIAGSGVVGSLLTCSIGTWVHAYSYTYEWLNDGVAIAGETTANYTSASTDTNVACRVIANGLGVATATSTSMAITHHTINEVVDGGGDGIGVVGGRVLIAGSGQATRKLSCSVADWQNASEYSFRWYLGGKRLQHTGRTFTPTRAMVGKAVYCLAVGTNSQGSVSRRSAARRIQYKQLARHEYLAFLKRVRIDPLRGKHFGGSSIPNRYCTVIGTRKRDVLRGTTGRDVICGLGGNDVIYGRDGDDIIDAGSGNDRVYGMAGNDRLYGMSGNDRMIGKSGTDRIWGGAGKDRLAGEGGNDRLYGGPDADTLMGGTGDDTMFGQAGNDRLFAGEGNDHAEGGSGNDRIFGQAGRDWLYGAAGRDYLAGGAGKDVLYGGEDSDTLRGGTGKDKLYGGHGLDSLRYQ